MDKNLWSFWMAVGGTICWGVCFVWMHRISSKQNRLMEEIRDQNKRIEKLSKVEHDLIKEVHPQVSEIKDGMTEVIATVKESNLPKPGQRH
jgi:hypothetical protein